MRKTHGQYKTSEYRTWEGMIQRCCNPKDKNYHRYGGRGIYVCPRWRKSFEAFYADMGPRPKGLTIERIDNNRGYEPSNCRWATRSEQLSNTRRTHFIAFEERTMTMKQWAIEKGLSYTTLITRLDRGWSIERALNEPKVSNEECGRRTGAKPEIKAQLRRMSAAAAIVSSEKRRERRSH